MSESVIAISQRIPAIVAVDDAALHLIDLALTEDRGAGDWTTQWTIPARTNASAVVSARDEGVIAGVALAAAVFLRLDPRVETDVSRGDGERVERDAIVCTFRGPARAILTGERVALNFLQRLSGIASLTRRYVDRLDGTATRILDTRKTTPGWRALEKGAVRAGGGQNHRLGLYDAVMIKENHAAVAGSLAEAIRRVREHNGRRLPVIVEVHSLDDLEAALAASVDRVLLDNMNLETLTAIMTRLLRLPHRPVVEASGNMTLDRVRAVAEAGVDFISVGALTHSAPVLDLSLRVHRP